MAKDEKTMETVTNFIFLGSKITTDGDCSYEINIAVNSVGNKIYTKVDTF